MQILFSCHNVVGAKAPQKLMQSHWCVPFTATFSKRRKIGALWSERCDTLILKQFSYRLQTKYKLSWLRSCFFADCLNFETAETRTPNPKILRLSCSKPESLNLPSHNPEAHFWNSKALNLNHEPETETSIIHPWKTLNLEKIFLNRHN